MKQEIRRLPLPSPRTIPSQQYRNPRHPSPNRESRRRLVFIYNRTHTRPHIPPSRQHPPHHNNRTRYRKKETTDKSHRRRPHVEPHHTRAIPATPQRTHGHRLLRYPHPPHGRTTTTGNTILSPYRTCPHTASLRGSTAERMGLCHQKQSSLYRYAYCQLRLRSSAMGALLTRRSGMVLTLRPLYATP